MKRKFKKYIPLCAAPSIASPPSINEEASLRVIIETASTRPLGLKLKTKTSLKAFSHQRRAKPFNTLRSKGDSFEKNLF